MEYNFGGDCSANVDDRSKGNERSEGTDPSSPYLAWYMWRWYDLSLLEGSGVPPPPYHWHVRLFLPSQWWLLVSGSSPPPHRQHPPLITSKNASSR
ncbi:hypothetical protein CRG98_005633 [Punica granatum]|uniref:Uncharacterized protein n=1 Tax=Punica granatum TaxID=22663 RepID=A0A2I0L1K1_PUNGR|nr:hypothetical protein CRG98_005633 [Punica granatum]